ncbi:hypothetical protein OEZ85_012313 [Tetradesmus obliquus]|uniref:AB hydrolase-1 domain-containing protein n=1 Tax=Tetradesmus obliquus TaxID=3088 RepID=A0ABY8TV20_TETOB|nr:hypothetical protein OEZ85_012313 [Tetradesmus obliquus]
MQIVRQSINLVDGRCLAYALFGNSLSSTAKNIIYHHGWPSSAAEGAIWGEAAAAHGICLIAVDRPGIGGSTYNPKGTFASFADDVSQLLHQLNLQQAVHGSRGLFHEMRLTTQPWAIDLSQITAPALVFQGDADVNVTVPQAKWLAGQLKNVKLQLFPGETHFSLVARHAHGILGMIKAECM